jgi:hypothetical protein
MLTELYYSRCGDCRQEIARRMPSWSQDPSVVHLCRECLSDRARNQAKQYPQYYQLGVLTSPFADLQRMLREASSNAG